MRPNNKRFARPAGVVVLVFAVAGVALLYSCSIQEDPVGVNDTVTQNTTSVVMTANATPGKEWTFLLYGSADAGPMYNPLMDFAAQFPSGVSVNALCFIDTYGETAKMWRIDENRNAVLLKDVGEVNMGSVTTLSDFLQYAKADYPAARYIISFYGHGGAWGGACTDMDPSFGVLRMPAMKQALEGSGGVDLVMFSAPCTMGALENAYQLKGCADVYIASEHLSGYMFWRTAMGSISNELNTNPSIANVNLGQKIIGWIEDEKKSYVRYGGRQYLTMSAIRTDRLDALRVAIDEVALAYVNDPGRLKALLDSARKKIVYFDESWIVDLNSMLLHLHKVETDLTAKAALKNAMRCLSEALIAQLHHPKYRDIGGLSIFLPDEASTDIIAYYVHEMFGLDFVQDSQWDELLLELFPADGATQLAVDVSVPVLLDLPAQQTVHKRQKTTERVSH
jgi:hypothetical protein